MAGFQTASPTNTTVGRWAQQRTPRGHWQKGREPESEEFCAQEGSFKSTVFNVMPMSPGQLHKELEGGCPKPQRGSPISGPGQDTSTGGNEPKEHEEAEGERAA